MNAQTEIRSAPTPDCILCGGNGELIYQDQHDRLFGTSGIWNLKQCRASDCGLIWLDPMPLKEDIGKAYLNYYTHSTQNPSLRPGLLRRIYRLMKRGYHADHYGYRIGLKSLTARGLGKLLYAFPIRRSEVDAEVRYLPFLPGGRLLDVGCGSGDWLLFMHGLGWQVEGVDFDARTVEIAAQKGVTVRLGSLEQQHFPGGSFDAVTLNHVIEHVPDPVGVLAECARILKPNGKLVVSTPNSSSLGHRLFRQNWRGLEPPRHLHLFSSNSLRQSLERAGFKKISIKQQISFFVINESISLSRVGAGSPRSAIEKFSAALLSRFINLVELCLIKSSRPVAECVTAVASRE